MNWRTTLLILFLCLSSQIGRISAQSAGVLDGLEGIMAPEEDRLTWSFAQNNANELEMLFSGLFLGYKLLVSSQDAQNCNFSPSCSEFGLLAVKRYGPVLGVIATFDRLTRCHGLDHEHYEIDPETGLLSDHP